MKSEFDSFLKTIDLGNLGAIAPHKVKYYKGYKGKPQKARGHYKEEHRYEERHDNRRDDHNDRGHGKHQDKGNHGRGRD